VIETAAVGLAAGLIAGLLGVGGGVLMVPALVVFLGLSQLEGEATSLLAIVPTAMVGAWRQSRYGNVRWRDALIVGGLSVAGGVGGVAAANALPERVLRLGFAAIMAIVAVQLVRRSIGVPTGRRG
jgi:uncharacterized membrane protein YfcA